MAVHKPGVIWSLRKPSRSARTDGLVRTFDETNLVVEYMYRGYTAYMKINRRDARLLAKRINQCLDATMK